MGTKKKNSKPVWQRLIWSGLVAVVLLGFGINRIRQGQLKSSREQVGLTTAVNRGPLTISLVESGTIRNRERVIVRSEVEGAQTIIQIVPEGKFVNKGDLLVELDSSTLAEQRLEQEARVLNSEAAVIQSSENLEVARNQAAADVSQAELNLRFAEMALEQYEKGDYPQELQQAEASITIANEELQRARDNLEWSRMLEADGYITRSELNADELALKRRELDLDLANGKRDVLTKYTHRQALEKLQSDIKQSEMALERGKRRARADVIRAEADLRAKESDLRHQKNRLEKLGDQIGKCKILAPADGMVIYATSVQTQRWRRLEPPEPGHVVRERQELIHLPATGEMMVEISVQEANLPKIRTGLQALITVESGAGVYFGELKKIGILPDSTSGALNPDLKLYICEVHIDASAEGLRQGMSCTVELLIEQHEDALYVPLQSLVRVNGSPTVYVAEEDSVAMRQVKVGLDNGRMVHILEGLHEGEKVLLAPPLKESERREREQMGEEHNGDDELGAENAAGGSNNKPAQTDSGSDRSAGRGETGRSEGSGRRAMSGRQGGEGR